MTLTPRAVPLALPGADAGARAERTPGSLPPVLLAGLAAVVVGVGVGLGFGTYVFTAVAALALALVCLATQRGLLLVLTLVPFGESVSVGPMTVGRLMAVVACGVLLVRLYTGRLRMRQFPPITWLPAAGFVVMIVASGLWADDIGGWTFAMAQAGLALAYFAAFALLIDHPAQVVPLLRVYVLGAVVAAAIGFDQFLIAERAVGLQGDPNIYAMYQVAALPAALALIRMDHGARRWLWAAAMAPIAVSIITSQSRGALLALVATALCLALLHPRRRLLVPLMAALGVGITVIAPLVDDRYALTRVSEDRASGRIDIWHVAWEAFLDRPWTGIGAGNFVPESIELLTRTPGVELANSHHLLTGSGIEVHNIYLEALVERGVFGFVTLAVFFGSTLLCLFSAARRFRTPAVEALAPMFLAFCVASVFLSLPNSKLLWMLAGLSAALLAVPARDPRPRVQPTPHRGAHPEHIPRPHGLPSRSRAAAAVDLGGRPPLPAAGAGAGAGRGRHRRTGDAAAGHAVRVERDPGGADERRGQRHRDPRPHDDRAGGQRGRG